MPMVDTISDDFVVPLKGPKGGTYYYSEKSKAAVKDGEYEKMEEAEVNKRIEAHEAWLASSPTK